MGAFATGVFADADAPEQVQFTLWNGSSPQSKGDTDQDKARIVYIPVPKRASTPTPAIVICPGGAYQILASVHEGLNIGRWYRDRGVAAIVLHYRLPIHGYPHPVPMLDAQRAIRFVRSHASDWNIDPAKVGIMGFSAGGHLASTVETHFDAGNPDAPDPIDRLSCHPDFAVLVYPVISMKAGLTHMLSRINLIGRQPDQALIDSLSNETQVTAQTPPTVVVVADDDKLVNPKNSRLMYEALQKAGVPSELQEYPTGGHGFGYGGNGKLPDKSPPGWLDKVGGWLKAQGFMPDTYVPAPAPDVPAASTGVPASASSSPAASPASPPPK